MDNMQAYDVLSAMQLDIFQLANITRVFEKLLAATNKRGKRDKPMQEVRIERYTLGQTTSQATDVDDPKNGPLPTFAIEINIVLDFSNVQATFSRSKTACSNASS
jgi:hypothetical protein